VSNTLQRTIDITSLFIRRAPLLGVGGFPNEPAFTLADWVRQFILAPPFAWRWNRATTSFNTVISPAQQDYVQNVPDFGWLEKAVLTDNAGFTKELVLAMDLGDDLTPGEPTHISPFLDNNTGSITFRLLPTPLKAYTIKLVYQKAAVIFKNTNDPWTPIPDYMSYLYNQGFLAKTYEYWADERFTIAMQLFVRQVVAANAGLSDTQRNIFLDDRLNTAQHQNERLQSSQFGRTGRNLS